ncbi:MAG TPA: AAA family ATPase [Pyrinomonadaceae bacterium]|nr:AAA family ATPase [Pyrinomonadaceae bacterium]
MDTWLENNDRYLQASLQWLRLRLQRLAPEEPDPPTQVVEDASGKKGSFSSWRTHASTPQPAVKLLTKGASLEQLIQEASVERDKAAQIEPAPALVLLTNRFALSSFERDTLLLCAAIEFDPSLGSLCGVAQGSSNRTYPTFALALSLFDDASWDALAAHRPLRYSRFLEISQPGSMPLTAAALRADERIVNFLKGLNVLDDRLATFFQPVCCGANDALSDSQLIAVDTVLHHLNRSDIDPLAPIQLVGTDAGSRLATAQMVCDSTNRELFRVNAEALPANLAEVETLARLWQRESALLPVALYIDAETLESGSAEGIAALRKFLSRAMGLVFIAVRENPIRLGDGPFAVEIQKPTPLEQCEKWTTLIGPLDESAVEDRCPQVLAGQFNFNLMDISGVVNAAIASPGEETFPEKVWEACRDLTRSNLDSLAQRLNPKATWDDLVLPDEQMNLMRQIAGQVRDRHKVYLEWGFARSMNRGFGISALFAGESGTGKTMAAEVIANDLQLNLYRIDLSAVVSKYIGETEKNLRRLFDAAERGGTILFFDEADALFGKRSEVKDSHDRYANIEINYLLQRMEAFSGLAILATNMKSALDAAFSRRLRFVLDFPYPSVKERKLIWQKALPAETPKSDLDFDRLARLNISGGNIHSIALNAAFIAAQDGQRVTMSTLMIAARAELKKLDRGFNEAELRALVTAGKSA